MIDRIYRDYRDIAEFYMIYIAEAHAIDDRRPVPSAVAKEIREHRSYGERCAVARSLVLEKSLTVPCLVDTMDNRVAQAYKGFPDRIFLVRKDGRLGVAGERGPFGFKPSIDEIGAWLAEYRRTGDEPRLPESP